MNNRGTSESDEHHPHQRHHFHHHHQQQQQHQHHHPQSPVPSSLSDHSSTSPSYHPYHHHHHHQHFQPQQQQVTTHSPSLSSSYSHLFFNPTTSIVSSPSQMQQHQSSSSPSPSSSSSSSTNYHSMMTMTMMDGTHNNIINSSSSSSSNINSQSNMLLSDHKNNGDTVDEQEYNNNNNNNNNNNSNVELSSAVTPLEQHLLWSMNNLEMVPDVCFLVKNERIYAHKLILARSTVFRNMFYNPLFTTTSSTTTTSNNNNHHPFIQQQQQHSHNSGEHSITTPLSPSSTTTITTTTTPPAAAAAAAIFSRDDTVGHNNQNNNSNNNTNNNNATNTNNNNNNNNMTVIDERECSIEAFLIFLKYMYIDKIVDNITLGNVIEISNLANKYSINSLEQTCERYMSEHCLNDDNIFSTFVHARLYSMRTLEVNSLKYILHNASRLLDVNSEDNRLHAFYDLCHDDVYAIVSDNAINISEIALFQAIVNWGVTQCERGNHHYHHYHSNSNSNSNSSSSSSSGSSSRNTNMSSSSNMSSQELSMLSPQTQLLIRVLGDLIYAVRYPLMDQVDFVKLVRPTCVLSQSEMLDIASFYITRDSSVLSHKFVTTPRRTIRILILGGDRDERIENVRKLVDDEVKRLGIDAECVDKFNANKKMITKSKLFEYSAILAFSNSSNFVDRTVLGDLLAEFVEKNNGGLVITTFANSGGLSLKGKLADSDMCPCALGSPQHDYSTADNPMIVLDKAHPIVKGVDRFILGKYRCRSPFKHTKDGKNKLLATWPDNIPAIAVRCDKERVVILNFFAVNNELITESWNKNQPAGAQIILNSLLWSSYAI